LRLAALFGLGYAGFRHDGFAEISFHKIGTKIGTEIGKQKVGSQEGSAAASKPPASDAAAPSAQDPSAG
jgi:hypothetical protein